MKVTSSLSVFVTVVVTALSLEQATARGQIETIQDGQNGRDVAASDPATDPTISATSDLPVWKYPLKASANGRGLVDQAGLPFFLQGDSAWELILQPPREEVVKYLDNRRQKGFNTILVELIGHKYGDNAPANYYGQMPFLSAGDFSTPNPDYFDHADWVIDQAASRGFVVVLMPLFLGFDCGDEGWCTEFKAATTSTLQAYADYVGKRYKRFPNIIWCVGGDVDPVAAGVASKVNAFATALKAADPTHLITAHNVRRQQAIDPWPNAAWLTLNSIYTDTDSYSPAVKAYSLDPARPFFLVEAHYEQDAVSTPATLRAQAYWTVLSGGVGHIFGSCVWAFGASRAIPSCPITPWDAYLDTSTTDTMTAVVKLFLSRPFSQLVPDTSHKVLTAGFDASRPVAAARASDGSTVIAYIPDSQHLSLDLTKIAGTEATLWWFNPRTGTATSIGTFPTVGKHNLDPPDDNDWVLVADSAALNRPAPGQATSPSAR